MFITAVVAGYLLIGLVVTLGAMKYDQTICRDWFGDVDPMLMLISMLLWPTGVVLGLLYGIAKLFRL